MPLEAGIGLHSKGARVAVNFGPTFIYRAACGPELVWRACQCGSG